jgi:hypothetical protein
VPDASATAGTLSALRVWPMTSKHVNWIEASVLTCLLAACSDAGGNAALDESQCVVGEIEVTACGGNEKTCVPHAPASSCDAFDRAQPTSDNPCRFGTKYSATCAQVTPGRVACACF